MSKDPFITDRNLLNPHFEKYKLHNETSILTQSILWSTQAVAAQTLTPDREIGSQSSNIGWIESRIRAHWNHLGVSTDGKQLAWVDSARNIHVAQFNQQTSSLSTSVLCTLPEISLETLQQRSEYPVVLSEQHPESPQNWIASDGCGTLFRISPTTGNILASAVSPSLQPNENETTDNNIQSILRIPFKLHAVHQSTALISTFLQGPSSNSYHYRVSLVDIPTTGHDNILRPIWSVLGSDVPTYTRYDQDVSKWRIGAPCTFLPTSAFGTTVTVTNEEDAEMKFDDGDDTLHSTRSPNYTWTQTNDSVTITIPLPHLPASTEDINIAIQTDRLSFHIEHSKKEDEEHFRNYNVPIFVGEPLWDNITLDGSTWTFDRSVRGDKKKGDNSKDGEDTESVAAPCVNIYLDKVNVGTRWTHLFSQDSTQPVKTETLDVQTLSSITSSLEKFVSDTPAEAEAPENERKCNQAGLGARDDMIRADQINHQSSANTLVGDEIDVEIDSQSPSDLTYFTYLPISNELNSIERTAGLGQKVESKGISDDSIVIKRDVDGLLFYPTPPPQNQQKQQSKIFLPDWIHKSTFPAIDFVLASKRSLRSAHHLGNSLVIALDSGGSNSIGNRDTGVAGNVYLYWSPPPGSKSTTSKSALLAAVSETTGCIVGIQAITSVDNECLVVLLCEKCLYVMKGLNLD